MRSYLKWIVGMVVVIVSFSQLLAGDKAPTPQDCAKWYDRFPWMLESYPVGLYGDGTFTASLCSNMKQRMEMSAEVFARYSINTHWSTHLRFTDTKVDKTGHSRCFPDPWSPRLNDLGKWYYGTALDKFELKNLAGLASWLGKGTGIEWKKRPKLLRDYPVWTAAEMETAAADMKGVFAYCRMLREKYPRVAGFITDDEPHYYAQATGSVEMVEKYVKAPGMTSKPSFGGLMKICAGEQTTSLYATGRGDEISPVIAPRYLVNDEVPGCVEPHDWHRLTVGPTECMCHGTTVTVQKNSSALISCVPHLNLSEKDISCLRLGLVAPRSLGQFDGFVDVSGEPLEVDVERSESEWYAARLGAAIIAFHPLVYAVGLDLPPARIALRRCERYDRLEIINYDGAPRRFTRNELARIMNGVAFEIASASDWESPAAFARALMTSTEFEDQFISKTRCLRYYRSALPDRGKTVLMLNYSTDSDGCAERGVDGLLASEPIWECDGIPKDSLPFMGSDAVIAPSGLPWSDLSVFWSPDSPWAINN